MRFAHISTWHSRTHGLVDLLPDPRHSSIRKGNDMQRNGSFGIKVLLATLCAVALMTPAWGQIVTVQKDPGNTWVTTALTGYSTYGDMMDGMTVTAYFAGGGSQSALWQDTGVGAGQAAGTDWYLSEVGDTFDGSG